MKRPSRPPTTRRPTVFSTHTLLFNPLFSSTGSSPTCSLCFETRNGRHFIAANRLKVDTYMFELLMFELTQDLTSCLIDGTPFPIRPDFILPARNCQTSRPLLQTELLMEKQAHASTWCEFSHPGQCSLIGVYQPELPKGDQFGRFYAFAGWVLALHVLLPKCRRWVLTVRARSVMTTPLGSEYGKPAF